MRRNICNIIILMLFSNPLLAQTSSPPSTKVNIQWISQESGLTSSLRGISVVSRYVAWVSGSSGKYAKTIDGGHTWKPGSVVGADSLDFRDVHVVDANMAYLLSAGGGERSRIYKTIDGGKSWKLQFINKFPKGFFNGLAFWDADNGIAYSDPVFSHPLIITTSDGGATWNRVPPEKIPPVLHEEYGFAASGTGVTVQGQTNVWICSGGAAARVFRSTDKVRTWTVAETPMFHGSPSSGIFSLAFKDANNGIVVGGDYSKPELVTSNVARTTDGGKSWHLIEKAQFLEFRSCVAYVPDSGIPILVAVGPSGSDGRVARLILDLTK